MNVCVFEKKWKDLSFLNYFWACGGARLLIPTERALETWDTETWECLSSEPWSGTGKAASAAYHPEAQLISLWRYGTKLEVYRTAPLSLIWSKVFDTTPEAAAHPIIEDDGRITVLHSFSKMEHHRLQANGFLFSAEFTGPASWDWFARQHPGVAAKVGRARANQRVASWLLAVLGGAGAVTRALGHMDRDKGRVGRFVNTHALSLDICADLGLGWESLRYSWTISWAADGLHAVLQREGQTRVLGDRAGHLTFVANQTLKPGQFAQFVSVSPDQRLLFIGDYREISVYQIN